MKKIMILVLVSIMLLSVACVKETIKPTKPETRLTNYNAADFSIGYPSDWVIKTQGPIAIFVSSKEGNTDDFLENLNVIVAAVEQPVTLDEYANAGVDQLKDMFTEFNMLSKDKTTLSGSPAIRLVYEASKDGQSNKFMQVVSKSDDKFFILTYTGSLKGYDTHLSTAQEMIASFKAK